MICENFYAFLMSLSIILSMCFGMMSYIIFFVYFLIDYIVLFYFSQHVDEVIKFHKERRKSNGK